MIFYPDRIKYLIEGKNWKLYKKKLGLKKIFSSKIRHSDPRKRNVYEQNNNLDTLNVKGYAEYYQSKRHGKLLSSKH